MWSSRENMAALNFNANFKTNYKIHRTVMRVRKHTRNNIAKLVSKSKTYILIFKVFFTPSNMQKVKVDQPSAIYSYTSTVLIVVSKYCACYGNECKVRGQRL